MPANGPVSTTHRYDKMNRFLPPAGEWGLQSEFECWHPDAAYAASETAGATQWKGPEIPPIKADADAPFVNLPDELERLIKHCWESAQVSPGAQRGPVQLGQQRQQAFNALQPKAQGDLQRKNAWTPLVNPTHDNRIGNLYNSPKMAHLTGVANDWKVHEQLERISAYTFRGDKRAPGVIRTDSGFKPPSSRTDRWYIENVIAPQFISYLKRRFDFDMPVDKFLKVYDSTTKSPAAKSAMQIFTTWRAMVDSEALHAGRMVAFEAIKGYISTTRAMSVAKGFAFTGWVYMTLVHGGFVLPAKQAHVWTPIFGEQEIAMPVPIPWANIFAFRQATNTRFVGPIYFRKGFDVSHAGPFREAFDLFSGKSQA